MRSGRHSSAWIGLGVLLVQLVSGSMLASACGRSVSEASSNGGSPDGSSGSGGSSAQSGFDGSADVTGVDHVVTKNEATTAFLRAVTCNPACYPSYFAHTYPSQDDCVASWLETNPFSWPGAATSAEQLMACLAAIDVTTCDGLQHYLTSPPDVCRFKGTLALSEACMSDWQCQSGSCNHLVGSSQWGSGFCGKCAIPATIGQPCDSITSCEHSLPCIDGVCAKPKLAGESCTVNDYVSDCAWPLVCIEGACSARLADGEPCDPKSTACEIESYCNQTKWVCEPPGTSQLGEPCWKLPDGVEKDCVSKTYCEHGTLSETSHCIPQIPVGQPCPQAFIDSCEMNAYCLGGICRLLEPSLCE